MISILATIHSCSQLLNIHTRIHQLPWKDYREIPDTARGVYIIEDDYQKPIYVGKGWIRTRQTRHWPKMAGTTQAHDSAPKGWQYLLESSSQLNPQDWTIYYTHLESETSLTALEGALIHLLQPLANDETFHDNIMINK